MEAHFSGRKTFLFDGARYSIETVTKYARYSVEKRKWVKFNSITEAKELYVYKQKGIYDNPENGYELVDAKLYFPQKRQAIKVAVYYQASQSKFFMNEESFVPLVRAHGLPNVSLHFTEDTGSDTIWAGKFSEQSKLKMLGYNVQQAEGMTAGERQNLLSSIIRSGQMTDAEVTNHLEMLIHLNSGKTNMVNACGSWREDLEFVQNNFGDLRRKKDFYGTKASSGDLTSQKKTSQLSYNSSSRTEILSTAPQKPNVKTNQPQKRVNTPAPQKPVNAPVLQKPVSTPVPQKLVSAPVLQKPVSTPTPQKPVSDSALQKPVNVPMQTDPRMPLLKRRAQLISELESSTGLFNIFKRMRLKREIREIEDKLND